MYLKIVTFPFSISTPTQVEPKSGGHKLRVPEAIEQYFNGKINLSFYGVFLQWKQYQKVRNSFDLLQIGFFYMFMMGHLHIWL